MEVDSHGQQPAGVNFDYEADLVFSRFNRHLSHEARTIKVFPGGLSFFSRVSIRPGATVFIRVTKYHPARSRPGAGCELRTVSLAQVRWCSQIRHLAEMGYEVGVRYFEPVC